jgi:elongation factor P hydroxylase
MNSTHKYEQLIEIFDGCFADDFNTRLIKGDDEPIYLPADARFRITASSLPTAFMPAVCTRFRTGALPESAS